MRSTDGAAVSLKMVAPDGIGTPLGIPGEQYILVPAGP